ncbi:MAG TPA: hypothetical protein VIP28_10380 [Nocardioides sp.]
MIAVLAFVALTVTIPALLLGHQGQDWPLRGPWRWLRARMPRRGPQAPVCGPQSPSRLPRGLRDAPEPAQSRSRRPAPSWAHTQPLDYEEAA